jgi:sulfide:quinone oxidoreductase
VLIAGGGVAALEAALALSDLAGDRITTTLLAPEREFVYRPLRVLEPFGYQAARRYPLDEIAADIGVELVRDAFTWLDGPNRLVRTESGRALGYDALLLAIGARLRPRYRNALTINDRRLDQQLHGLIQDVEGGYVRRLAFIVPAPTPWPLPIYELALLTARRAYDMNVETEITIVTPEAGPLALFGDTASAAVAELLDKHGITCLSSSYCEVPKPGNIYVHPGSRHMVVDRLVALPQLFGPSKAGVPGDPANGFIPIDPHCRVRGLENVWAAGDATDFAVKHGGIASQQADTAAADIAALAGASVQPLPFQPVIKAVLLGGEKPLYLSAEITGGHGSSSVASENASFSPTDKIAAKYLAPYLETRDRLTGSVR